MNKLVLTGIITVIVMLGATWLAIGGSKGGLNGDIVNSLAVVGAVILVLATVFVVVKYVRQMQEDTATGELADENWDGIGEYKNDLPMGWALTFLVLIIWGVWYWFVGYPLNAYSQIGEYNEDSAAAKAKFETQLHAKMDAMSDAEKADFMVEMGEAVFLAECKVCHGLQADGLDGKAADLNHRIAVDSIKYTIANGANNLKTDFPGGMPPMMLTDAAQIDAVAKYIANGFPENDEAGKNAFMMGGCTGCHGDHGEGIAFTGPKLNGFDPAMVASVLKNGKKANIGTMPKFDRLSEDQVKALGAYITSLSK